MIFLFANRQAGNTFLIWNNRKFFRSLIACGAFFWNQKKSGSPLPNRFRRQRLNSWTAIPWALLPNRPWLLDNAPKSSGVAIPRTQRFALNGSPALRCNLSCRVLSHTSRYPFNCTHSGLFHGRLSKTPLQSRLAWTTKFVTAWWVTQLPKATPSPTTCTH